MSAFYWDTSAAINAAVSAEVWRRLAADVHYTRSHLFCEFFAVLTGRGILVSDSEGKAVRVVLSPADACAWLRRFSQYVTAVELDSAETLDALDQAERKGIQGGRVYDYMHAAAAEKAKVDAVLTRNRDDFIGLSSLPVEWP
jgi:predicted nucleic acid-binding protein